MADGRKLDSGEAIRLEQSIVHRYESIQGQLRRLQGTIDMIENNWTGQGAGAFNAKQTEINDHVVALGQMLEKVLDGVNINRKDKEKLEDELHGRIRQIDVQDLGGQTSALSSY
ncbi:WXG100 family type VII secretion target [Streptomyces sp. NPDC006743]|uniref:WXG100 family type VII secretion target n=1 Tax=Streptomyces sp. NPDC006743 TaxID=3154480 RepID=UPI003451DAC3